MEDERLSIPQHLFHITPLDHAEPSWRLGSLLEDCSSYEQRQKRL